MGLALEACVLCWTRVGAAIFPALCPQMCSSLQIRNGELALSWGWGSYFLGYLGPEQLPDCLKGCDVVVIPAGVPRKPGVCLKALPHVSLQVRWGSGFPLNRIKSLSPWQRKIPEAPLCLRGSERSLPRMAFKALQISAVSVPCSVWCFRAHCPRGAPFPLFRNSHRSLMILLRYLPPWFLPTLHPSPSHCLGTCPTRLFLLRDRLTWNRDPVSPRVRNSCNTQRTWRIFGNSFRAP